MLVHIPFAPLSIQLPVDGLGRRSKTIQAFEPLAIHVRELGEVPGSWLQFGPKLTQGNVSADLTFLTKILANVPGKAA